MKRLLMQSWCGLVVAALAAGCHDDPTKPLDETATLAVSPGNDQANGTVRGQVLGRLTSAGNETEPVSGAAVEVFHMEQDPDAPADTVLYRRRLVGTVLTGADGRFELTKVPEGSYVLLVDPPAPYLPGGEWGVTAPGTGVIDITFVLDRPRAPAASDLRGEVRGHLTADSAGATEPVAGAEVKVYALETAADSGHYTRNLVGTAVTDAAGRFALDDIAEGDYYQWSLDITPPVTSPYGARQDLIVVSSGTGATEVRILLSRR